MDLPSCADKSLVVSVLPVPAGPVHTYTGQQFHIAAVKAQHTIFAAVGTWCVMAWQDFAWMLGYFDSLHSGI